MRKLLFLITLTCLLSCRQSIDVKAQTQNKEDILNIKLLSNFNVLGYSNEEKDIIKLWEEVLNKDFRQITEDDLKYWLPSEQFKIPIRFLSFLNGFKSAVKTGQATVIALFPIGNDTFLLKTMFNSTYGEHKKMQLEYIYSVHVVKTNQGFKFLSLPEVYYKNWNKKTVGGITYCYDKSRVFNPQLAIKMDSFNIAMSQLFKTNKQSPIYFIGKNVFEAHQIMGYDFSPEQATMHQIGAVTQPENNVIFAGNDSEYYPHEMVHLYTREFWGKDGAYFHQWIDEGLAVYFGDYLGKPLEHHLKVMKAFLDKHPEEPLNDISTFYFKVDNEFNTNFMYEIGGLICKRVYEKESMNGIFDLLKSGNTDEDFYKAVEKHFNVKKENFGAFIRKELENI
jgi:hypothetical protein